MPADDLSVVEESAFEPSAPDGLAHATPGEFAIAAPMPSATAKAPTRPMYLAYPVPLLQGPATITGVG